MSKPNTQIETRPHDTPPLSSREAEIRGWIVAHLAVTLELDPGSIDVNAPFDRYGLDSYAAVNLVGELEVWLGCELSPTIPYEYFTVASLARYLADHGDGSTGP